MMKPAIKIAPSILASDFARLGEQVVEAGRRKWCCGGRAAAARGDCTSSELKPDKSRESL
jgi:hypothetical protein